MLAAINLSTRDHIKVTGEEAQRLKTTLTRQAHIFEKLIWTMLRWQIQCREYDLPVAPLVVIPRHKFHKIVIQCNSSLGVKNARPALGTANMLRISTL